MGRFEICELFGQRVENLVEPGRKAAARLIGGIENIGQLCGHAVIAPEKTKCIKEEQATPHMLICQRL